MALQTGRTYTDPRGPIFSRIQDLSSKVATDVKNAPVQQQQMGEQLMQNEGVLGSLSGERGKLVQQLLNADVALAEKYARPESPTYIEDPMARQRGVTGMKSALWGGLADVDALLSARKEVLGDAMEKGMQIYNAGIQATQLERDDAWKQLEYLDKLSGSGVDDELDKLLTPNEAIALGVPYGTTRRGAMGGFGSTETQRGLQTKYQSLESTFKSIEEGSKNSMLGYNRGRLMIKQLEAVGPIGQRQSELADYHNFSTAMVSTIARAIAGETGPLNEQDIARAGQLVPQITDNEYQRAAKLARLREYIDNFGKQAYGEAQYASIKGGGGVPTAEYAGGYQPQLQYEPEQDMTNLVLGDTYELVE